MYSGQRVHIQTTHQHTNEGQYNIYTWYGELRQGNNGNKVF